MTLNLDVSCTKEEVFLDLLFCDLDGVLVRLMLPAVTNKPQKFSGSLFIGYVVVQYGDS